jgi:hypothetical protein
MLIRKNDLEDLRASLEFHLDNKGVSKNILDRLYILYKDRNYKMRDFIVSYFPGKPYGKKKPIKGLDILKLINGHIKKLYIPYYDFIDKNLIVTGELENKKWLANIITFIINYFSEKDSTMDIDFNMGVVSFVPGHPLPVKADIFMNPFAVDSK